MDRPIFLFYDVMHTTVCAILTFNIMIHVARIKQKCTRGFWEGLANDFLELLLATTYRRKIGWLKNRKIYMVMH